VLYEINMERRRSLSTVFHDDGEAQCYSGCALVNDTHNIGARHRTKRNEIAIDESHFEQSKEF
jgi:hypothetical protein